MSSLGITIGHYQMGKALGKGTFGQVKQGTHLITGEKVAIKILEKEKIKDKKDVERITREIKILKKVRHPNVIQLYEIIETDKELYMVMEYCSGGELFDFIVSHQKLSERQASKYYQELMSGIEYLHKSGVCHRDLKPENLLLDFDKTLKIVDFGLSNMYEKGETLKTACGSPCYAAPEMIAGKRYNGLQTDIWSSGVVLFAMVCGYLPFEDPKTSNLYKKILSADYQIPKFVSQEGRDFMKRILDTDPESRITMNEIRANSWFKQFKLPEDREPGLYPGLQKMPFNEDFLKSLANEHEFDFEYSAKCLEANRHNHITATYHLINKKNKRIQVLKNSIAPQDNKWVRAKNVDLNQTMQTVSPKINTMLESVVPQTRESSKPRSKKTLEPVEPQRFGQSKSPDKYHINGSLVVTLNEAAQANKNPQLQQFNMKYKAGIVFPSTTTATTANSYQTEQRKASEASRQPESGVGQSSGHHQRFNSINVSTLNQNMLVGNLVGQNPLKLSLPLRYIKNNPGKKLTPGTAKAGQDLNRTVMNATNGLTLNQMGPSIRPPHNTAFDQKKMRIPVQLFTQKLNQTLDISQAPTRRAKLSSRQPTPETQPGSYAVHGRGITPNEYATSPSKMYKTSYKQGFAQISPNNLSSLVDRTSTAAAMHSQNRQSTLGGAPIFPLTTPTIGHRQQDRRESLPVYSQQRKQLVERQLGKNGHLNISELYTQYASIKQRLPQTSKHGLFPGKEQSHMRSQSVTVGSQ